MLHLNYQQDKIRVIFPVHLIYYCTKIKVAYGHGFRKIVYGENSKIMKIFFTWLMYIAALFSALVILLFIYFMVDPFRKQRQRKLYYQRSEEIKRIRKSYAKDTTIITLGK